MCAGRRQVAAQAVDPYHAHGRPGSRAQLWTAPTAQLLWVFGNGTSEHRASLPLPLMFQIIFRNTDSGGQVLRTQSTLTF